MRGRDRTTGRGGFRSINLNEQETYQSQRSSKEEDEDEGLTYCETHNRVFRQEIGETCATCTDGMGDAYRDSEDYFNDL